MLSTTLLSPTGADLHLNSMIPARKPKGVVQILHGLAEHGARYERFMRALAKAGLASIVHDHRGHGKTSAADAPRGIFANENGWEKVLKDCRFINSEIRRRYSGISVILLGHSMGGMLAYNLLLKHPEIAEGFAVWNAALSKSFTNSVLGLILKCESVVKGRATESIATKLGFETFNKQFKPNRTCADWLSKDVVEARKYQNDPDCGWLASNSMWRDMLGGIRFGASDHGIGNIPENKPVFLLGGNADPSVNFGRSIKDLEKRLKAAGLTNLKTVIRENGRHEALNEPQEERNEVTQMFTDWANEVTQGK